MERLAKPCSRSTYRYRGGKLHGRKESYSAPCSEGAWSLVKCPRLRPMGFQVWGSVGLAFTLYLWLRFHATSSK